MPEINGDPLVDICTRCWMGFANYKINLLTGERTPALDCPQCGTALIRVKLSVYLNKEFKTGGVTP